MARPPFALPRALPRPVPRPAPTLRLIPDGRYGWQTAALIWVLVVYLTVPEGLITPSRTRSHRQRADQAGMDRTAGDQPDADPVASFPGGGDAALGQSMAAGLYRAGALSVAWSIEPSFTIKRVTRLLTFLTAALAFSLVGWHDRKFQNMLRPLVTLLMLGSLTFGLLAPTLAIEQSEQFELAGAWHGLAMQKNSLGALAGSARYSGCTPGWPLKPPRSRPCWRCAVWNLPVAVAQLHLADGDAVCAGLHADVTAHIRGHASLHALSGHTVCGAAVDYSSRCCGSCRAPMPCYRDHSLHGKGSELLRTDQIWDIITERIAQHPLLGGGYGAYWTGNVPESQSYEFMDG